MDPLSHALTGSLLAQSVARPQHIRAAALLGALAGMAPDLDFFISSPVDPLLHIEYHRHFTHALAFVPIGALLCAWMAILCRTALQRILPNGKLAAPLASLPFSRIYLYCFLGYLQGGLLDACTSYGTHLLWPFSETRVAWSYIAIIDPLFTIPLLIFAVFAIFRKRILFARLGVAWALCYLFLGIVQHHRAIAAGTELAHQRGLSISRIEAKPSIFNNVLFRVLIQAGDTYYVDAIRVGWFSSPIVYEGGVQAVPQNYLQDVPPDSQLHQDLARFAHFSGQWIYFVNDNPEIIGDLRYSMLPNSLDPLWSISVSREHSEEYSRLNTERRTDPTTKQALLSMILGNAPDAILFPDKELSPTVR